MKTKNKKLRYYVIEGGYIYLVVDGMINSMLLIGNGQWEYSSLRGKLFADVSRVLKFRPISPLAVRHFIAMGGYNNEGLV